MQRLAGSLLLLCLYAGLAHGMDCSFGTSENIVSEFVNSCPSPFQSRDKSYCCYDFTNKNFYCCDVEEFTMKTGLGIIIPVIIAAAIVISLIVCCVSCLCCSCCPWYRRRHQGTVYGICLTASLDGESATREVQTPNVVHVVQNVPSSYNHQAAQAQQNNYVPYPTNPAGIPPQPAPQYNSEAYAKQAPYNPAYPPQ